MGVITEMDVKKLFISYSWESKEHDEWVEKLANSLEIYPDIHVIWDKYDLDSAVDKNLFMEEGVFTADYMLVVATETYVKKANERQGGVGIETFMNVSRHWQELQDEQKKRTNSIVILKDKGQVPNYLKGHLYVDFTSDDKFDENLAKLLAEINKSSKVIRPRKISQSSTAKKNYRLTKAEELIAISNPSRKVLISESDGTDFSLNQRIKFEVWENNSVFPSTIVVLHPNINMKQTLIAAAQKINKTSIPVENLLVLSETAKRESLLSNLQGENKEKYQNSISKEITYREYIWQYCIDDEFKVVDKPIEIDFYIEQDMKDETGDEYPAIKKLVESLQSKSDYISYLLVGSGGMGKSSLCLSLINKLTESNNDNVPFLISSEEIRKYCDDNSYNPHHINSIFDLYEIQAKTNQHKNILDRKRFDLALLSGSLTIVIDGLDEFPSIFGEKFDTRLFLESVSSLHSELGSSRILITSRDQNLLNDDEIEALNIKKYELLGFQEKECMRYIRKRFRGDVELDVLNDISKEIVKKVKDTSLYEYGRIVPFFIDVICNIYEDYEGFTDVNFNANQEIPYKCLNKVTDGIIYSIFERETFRHSIPIPSNEMFDIFCYFSAIYGKRWGLEQVEQYVSMMYGDNQKHDAILKSISINPLLVKSSYCLELKYDFTLSYFNSIYMIDNVINKTVNQEFVSLLSKTSFESTVFYDLKEYFISNLPDVGPIVKSIIEKIEKSINTDDSPFEKSRKTSAIEFLFYLSVMAVDRPNISISTDMYKYIYGKGVVGTIHNGYARIQIITATL